MLPEPLKDDHDFMMEVVRLAPLGFRWASSRLRDEDDMVSQALGACAALSEVSPATATCPEASSSGAEGACR